MGWFGRSKNGLPLSFAVYRKYRNIYAPSSDSDSSISVAGVDNEESNYEGTPI